MPATLRLYDPATDIPGCVTVYNVTFPLEPTDATAWARRDAARPAASHFTRWVAPVDSQIVGMGYFMQTPPNGDAVYTLRIMVLPAYERRGIGAALYDQLMAELAPLAPRGLRAAANLTRPHSLHFWARRGFVECMREVDAVLDLTTGVPAPAADLEARLASQGIRLTSLADLPDPDRYAPALHDLSETLRLELPACDAAVRISFDQWLQVSLHADNFLPAAYFVALANETPIGLSVLTAASRPDWLDQRLTGVLPAYRRRGIALALKLRGLAYARAHGCRFIRTDSAIQNTAMRGLNRQLGFVEHATWVFYKKP